MVRIISDSSCDLSDTMIVRYQVTILPLSIILDQRGYLDGKEIIPEGIYAWTENHREAPKVASFSVDRAVECFRPLLDAGDELICFAVSENMSASAETMRLAAKELRAEDRVHVVNSQNLSTGVGLLVVEAAELAKQGRNAEEILAVISALRPRVKTSFVVNTLMYLHRGGYYNSLATMLGNELKIHPRISMEHGKMQSGKKYRGSMDHVIAQYVNDMKDDLMNAKTDRVMITHSGCSEDQIMRIHDYLDELNHFRDIVVTRAEGFISSLCGPGAFGLSFIDAR